MQESEQKALAERARLGNREAIDRLLTISYPRLLRTARALLGNVDEAHDAAQEAAVAVFERVHQLKSPESFGSWSSMVVRRICLRFLEHRRRSGQRQVAFDDASFEPGSATDGSFDDLIQLRQVLGHLGEPMLEIMRLRLVLGLTVCETASFLGLSKGAVKARLHRARHKALQLA
jgi:RNA polymerase sigma-70 factor (ECF subfamily)